MTRVSHIRATWAITAAVAVALASATWPAFAPPADAAPSGIQPMTPVPGHSAGATAQSTTPKSSTNAPLASRDDLSGTYNGALSGTDDVKPAAPSGTSVVSNWHPVGTSGIAVAAAAPSDAKRAKGPLSNAAVGAVNATLLTPTEARKLGVTGPVLQVTRTDGATGAGRVAVSIPDSVLDGLYGSDFASRVRWVQVDSADQSALKSGKKLKTDADTVASARSASNDATVITPTVATQSIMVVPMGAPVSSTGTGNFGATSLAPSSLWDVSAQTGDFSWSYPMRTPPAAAGPAPSIGLNYSSQSVDGETGSTNNQPSAAGEGWSLSGAGFIERTYVSCSQDSGASGPVTTSGDLCWKTDNATISLGGHSGQLVRDATTGVWKLQSDDGSRIEHLVGTTQGCAANGTYDTDCWRLTTTDGTQYYFGLNQLPGWTSGKPTTNSTWTVPVYGNDASEPCHAATFAASSCVQAWRWNLDYVVDTHANAEAIYYDAEANRYSQNGTTVASYIRGGQVDHIDYGFTNSNAYVANAASDQVLFGYDAYGRCSDATHATCTSESLTAAATTPASPSAYPDVPFDQNCASGACTGQVSPTFWTDGMLDTVTTRYLSGASYQNVDQWTLSHSFPSPGDGTNAALWMTQVSHSGLVGGTLTEPATVFTGATLQNRVWAIDGLAPLDKYRITSIATSLGAMISVNYSAQQCTAANAASIEANANTNTNRCFPQWWTPQVVPVQPAQLDLFHLYVVTSVVSSPMTGGGNDAAQETDYVYTGTPAWRYNTSPFVPEANRTWSTYAGYNTVEVRTGPSATPSQQQTTTYAFYQGMDGDRATTSGGTKSVFVTGSTTLPDSLWFAGQVRDTKVLNGAGGAVLSDTLATPWASAVTSNDGITTARMVGDLETVTTEPTAAGGSRTTDVTTARSGTYNLVSTVNTTTSDAGSTCATTSYAAANTTAWIIGAVDEQAVVGTTCATVGSAVYPAAAISDSKTSYDSLAWGTAPTKGDATQTQVVDKYTGTTAATAHWSVSGSTTYDSLGRPLVVTDILGHTATNAYTPAAGAAAGSGPLTSQTVTNTSPFSWASKTTVNPAWGAVLSSSDANNNATTATYDSLGRRVSVWFADHTQAAYPTAPSVSYAYTLSTTTPNVVATTTLASSTVETSYTLFDGLGRQVQTQAPSEATGANVTDTAYDAWGRVSYTNSLYWTTSVTPSTALFVPTSQSQIPSKTVTQYDAAGRATASVLMALGVERYRSTTAYLGKDRVDSTPPAGGTPTSTFTNTLGQTTSLVQYLAATPLSTATQETTTYGYNAQGSMTSMTDPAGNHWSWGFDVLGHQTSATDPDAGASSKTYDLGGNVLTSTDARGITLAYSYDALNRPISEYKGVVGTGGSEISSWVYDTLAKGQLTSSTSYYNSTVGHPGAAFTDTVTGYDAAYRPSGDTVAIPTGSPAFGGTSYTNSVSYYQDGSVSAVQYPAEGGLAAESVSSNYTGLGNLIGVSGTNTYLVGNYTPIGQPSEYTRGGTTGLISDFGYDQANGQISEIKQRTKVGSTYTVAADSTYTHDNAGDVTSIATTSASTSTDTQCFTYDYQQDLTAAWTPTSNSCAAAPSSSSIGGPAPYWSSYVVDPATGNRTSTTQNAVTAGGASTSHTYAYPVAGGVRPHSVGSVTNVTGGTTTTSSYGYDASGDTTSRSGQTVTYDATGKPATVVAGSSTQTLIHDASGGLLLESDPVSGSTLYLGATELHVAAGSSAVTAVRTYTANGAPIAERTT
ncbi:MAG: hypothetical protein JWN36_2126, partial [Microbacteriaceae bacterium]|nr:hypothetical protein [Microbacteriaceae bacterium]